MNLNSARRADSLLSSSFIALVFSLSGWALLETWLLLMHVNGRGQVLAAVPGSILVFLSVKHFSRFQRGPFDNDGLRPYKRRRISGSGAWYALFLCAIGGLIGLFILIGATLLFAALVVPLSVIPWSRLPFCRNHFFAAATMMLAGIGLALFMGRHAIDPMFLAIACWIFWTCTCFVLLVRAERLWRNRRSVRSMSSASESQLLPD